MENLARAQSPMPPLPPLPPPRGILSAPRPDGLLDGRRFVLSPQLASYIHHYWAIRWSLRSPFKGASLRTPRRRSSGSQPPRSEAPSSSGSPRAPSRERSRATARPSVSASVRVMLQARVATIRDSAQAALDRIKGGEACDASSRANRPLRGDLIRVGPGVVRGRRDRRERARGEPPLRLRVFARSSAPLLITPAPERREEIVGRADPDQ